MKKFLALCMAGVMLMSSPVFADAIVYNGAQIQYTSQQPVIIDGRTYVPIRVVFEKLGFDVEWDANTKLVGLSNDYYNVVLTTGTSKIFSMKMMPYYTMTFKKLENPVKIINGRTMLPLREILESIGYELTWDAKTKTTFIKDNNDYAAMEAEQESYENELVELDELEYKLDNSKPVGKLTTEEKAWLENYYTAIAGDDLEKMSDMDFDDLSSSKEALEYIALTVESIKKNITSVECPDSLKEVENLQLKSIDELKTASYNIVNLGEMLEGEPDEVRVGLGMSAMFCCIAPISRSAVKAQAELNNFYKAGNYDLEAELGSLYTSLEEAEFEPAE